MAKPSIQKIVAAMKKGASSAGMPKMPANALTAALHAKNNSKN